MEDKKVTCEFCGKELTPCPARVDGEPTFVGFYRCACSRWDWNLGRDRPKTAEEIEIEETRGWSF